MLTRFKEAFEATKYSLALGCSIYLFTAHVATISAVKGSSMLPTFNPSGDMVLVDLLFWKFKPLEAGSIMVYQSPVDPDKLVVKRLIGLPGDELYIDPTASTRRIAIPKGHVWMQGDNYVASNDSRHYGPVPIGLLRGQILRRIWTFGK